MSQPTPFAINCAVVLKGTGIYEQIPDTTVPPKASGAVDGLEGRTDTANFIVTNGDPTNALTDFKVQIQVSKGGSYIDFLLDANWTVPDNNMLIESPVQTLAGGASALCMIRTGPIHGLKFFAKGSANGGTVPLTVVGTIG